MEIRLLERGSFFSGKKTPAFGRVPFFSPADHLRCSREADRSPDTLAFAISTPGIWATRREKKKNLMSAPKIPKK